MARKPATKKEQIIKAWNKTKQVHPSYAEVAKTTESNKTYVFKVIQDYKRINNIKV